MTLYIYVCVCCMCVVCVMYDIVHMCYVFVYLSLIFYISLLS